MTTSILVTKPMNTAGSPSTTAKSAPTATRTRTIIYWIATVFVAGNALVAGAMNIFRIQPFPTILLHLGYPAYFGIMLGIWKVLGGLSLTAPRCPRLKEWAYAGSFVDYTAATVSYLAVGDGTPATLIGPLVTIILLVVSWALRPASRRLPAP
jgi:hypothetical protein